MSDEFLKSSSEEFAKAFIEICRIHAKTRNEKNEMETKKSDKKKKSSWWIRKMVFWNLRKLPHITFFYRNVTVLYNTLTVLFRPENKLKK